MFFENKIIDTPCRAPLELAVTWKFCSRLFSLVLSVLTVNFRSHNNNRRHGCEFLYRAGPLRLHDSASSSSISEFLAFLAENCIEPDHGHLSSEERIAKFAQGTD